MRLALATVALAASLHLPAGYHASVYARGFEHPTALSFGPDRRLYVSEDVGTIVSVRRGSTRARPYAHGLVVPLGLLWRGRTLYVAESGKVEALRAGTRRTVVRGLPFGRHQQDAIVAGPDGRLYLGSGSTCNACIEHDRRSAAILSFRADGTDLRVVASGLRNPYGLVFVGSVLYATVNARDDLGRSEPAETVVRIRRGADYGWPACWGGYALQRLVGACLAHQVGQLAHETASSPGAATSSSPSGASTARCSTAVASCAFGGAASARSRPASTIRSHSPSTPAATCWSPTGAEA